MQIPVLAYHKIDQPTSDIKLRGAFTSPKNFAKQMLYLKKQNFVFYTASGLIDFYMENGAFPAKAITVTFDDGWKDNYTNAFPILRDLQIKATVFLVPSCIGLTTAKVVADGESEREHLALTDIRAMSDYGIEFGSHTLNHKLLHQISPSEIEFEVFESKKVVENLLQKPCRVFAYPAGFFTETAQAAVKNARYIAAFSTVYGENETVNLYALNRVEILRRNRFLFQFARTIKPLQTENF
ncbi:MAG: polysaccharide deacetylase family protein [Acidobacteriota bacterium]|nr:polysaccharide deacetylase family protein [Acidobacteriota bacterium]